MVWTLASIITSPVVVAIFILFAEYRPIGLTSEITKSPLEFKVSAPIGADREPPASVSI